MKTSETDPIRVDYVPAELLALRGRIGMTFAPGKKGGGVHGQWHRELGADLARIRDVYRTSLIVTLIEPHELALLGIEALFETVRELGLQPIHVPIKDGSVPKMDALVALVGKIIAAASEGKNVVVHCRGGLGRAGLVTACCVVACGQAPAEAIRVVRRARKDAIENVEQEQVVSKFEAAWYAMHSAPPKRAIEPSVSRFAGCLLGGALGDALGYPIEFTKPGAAIAARHGKVAPADLRFAVEATGVVSDDTQMTLFTAEAIVRAANRAADRGISSVEAVVTRAYLRWHATQTGRVEAEWSDPLTRGWLLGVRELHAQRARKHVHERSRGHSRRERKLYDRCSTERQQGCGAVMRSAPFGLAASREEAFRWARDAGATRRLATSAR